MSAVLIIQHAESMRRIILSSVACLAVPYFSHYLINGTIFGEKLLNIKCVLWFVLQLLSETFLILRRIQRDIMINVHRSLCTHCCCQIVITLELSRQIFEEKKPQISNFMKIRPVVTELLRADRRADMSELTVDFRNFANTSKNLSSSLPASIPVSVKVGTGANSSPTPF
jgi:hypothetical protein